ncbi:transcriptional regulator [Nitratireductor indicus C115]|uniref:Transcriptional regulator n=1 Tax=Nitratireductor indicus C115 TaxID=1231190 RepID=K2NUG0_9HYPH|nr:LacI family DNA-binding transcriptional regulator [Nitratireductor indicus]EKF41499.1 transcriptional regulator [Nitratireductor indicus C115]SFQ69511.1 LacI family transcriptional regulator [Nitratireductor indicus]
MKPVGRNAQKPVSGEGRSVGIREVARRAGVSTATVSRALNNPDSVSATLRARIHATIDEIGYIPDASARALSSRKTRTIGAIVPTIDNAMFAQGLQALQTYLATKDYLLLLATNEYDLEVELKQARNLVSRGIDGLILRGDQRHDDLRRMLLTQKIPFVNVGVYEPEKPYPSIGVNNTAAGRRIARHLMELGHRRVAIVAALQRNNDRAQARVSGVLDVLAANDAVPPDRWHLQVNYKLDDARQAARVLLTGADRPTAVICGNDVIAYGVMLEAIKLGIEVPAQLSVVGFDDLEWSRHLRPSLTTIHMPTDEIWVRAGEYLVEHLSGGAPIMHREIDFSMVVRESTAPPPRDEAG